MPALMVSNTTNAPSIKGMRLLVLWYNKSLLRQGYDSPAGENTTRAHVEGVYEKTDRRRPAPHRKLYNTQRDNCYSNNIKER